MDSESIQQCNVDVSNHRLSTDGSSQGQSAPDQSASKKKSRSSRRTSEIWNDFQLYQSPSKKMKAKCNHCGKNYNADAISGTSNLKRHLEKCPKYSKLDGSTSAKAMKEKFGKYWHQFSAVLAFAVILDPRFKLKYVKYQLKKFDPDYERKANDFLHQLKTLFKEYEKNAASSHSRASNDNQVNDEELNDDYRAFENDDIEDDCISEKTQLDLYLSEQRIPITSSFDILQFWKEYQFRYPELSTMARDILSIPITTVASESAFSIGGRILNKWRSSLSTDTAEVLVTTHNWLCGYKVEKAQAEMDEEINLAKAMTTLSLGSEEASNVVD